VTAFIVSLVAGLLLTGVVLVVARRRPVGQPLTWGEAFAAAVFVFALFVLAYGVIPHEWLTWCDKELAWRKDKTGIPLGPFGMWFFHGHAGHALGFIPVNKNSFWPNGITFFGRGRIMINAEHIRDVVGSGIYIGGLSVHFYLWAWWQKRGQVAKDKAQREALTTSAYGRPLTKAEA
jgi:hypothetical protein